jgi:xanthine dehydrogenase YagR molybdenum-binding subunit
MKHYLNPVDIQPSETQPSHNQQLPWQESQIIGRRLPRVDAYERVSGSATYTNDVVLPDMLHAVIVRCPHAHARVVRVETERAAVMPGVRAVITGSSPGATIPWYFGEQGPTSRLFDDHCRYAGEEVAAVAAETTHQAWDAARAIEVEYEVLPFVVDMDRALDEDAAQIHDAGNLAASDSYERGDVDAGFAEADVVLEETYTTSCQLHVPMETFVSVAQWKGNRLTVWDSTQGVYDRQQDLARFFQLPLSSVQVSCAYTRQLQPCSHERLHVRSNWRSRAKSPFSPRAIDPQTPYG